MDYKNIQELIKTVSDSLLTSFEIDTEGMKIKMEKKEQQVVVEKTPAYSEDPETEPKGSPAIENRATNPVSIEKLQSDIDVETKIVLEENLFVVKSPIVGTMYSSPGPDSHNFVKVGSNIKKGDTLCILEAMKLMNEIESEVDGEIVEALVTNGDMVEYGQPLFKIRKK